MSLFGLVMKAKNFYLFLILIVANTTIGEEVKRADFWSLELLFITFDVGLKVLYKTRITPSSNLKRDIVYIRVHTYMLVRLAFLL